MNPPLVFFVVLICLILSDVFFGVFRGRLRRTGVDVRSMTVEMPDETAAQFIALQRLGECGPAVLIRRSLSLYERVKRAEVEGCKVILERPDGSQIELEVP